MDALPRKKRLRGLDEFVVPEFVGRMDRVRTRRKRAWHGLVLATIIVGAIIGMLLA